MEELRSEIRAAFEKDQAAHPPTASLRRDIVEGVADVQPRRIPNLQWLAVAAAAILAILVVAGLMSTRLGHRASVPSATPQAGPLKDYGPPPAGVPLTYLIDPRNGAWLQAYDWQGRPRGTVKLAQPVTDYGSPTVFAAPDGSGFLYQPQGGVTQYLDRLGRPIAPGFLLPAALETGWMWADDSRHFCVLRFASPSGEWQLITRLPGGADQLAGVIAPDPNTVETAINLVSCSFQNNTAIVLRTTSASPTPPRSPVPWQPAPIGVGQSSELWVFRISDGKVLSRHAYSTSESPAAIVASDDGAFIAENSSQSTLVGATAQPTIIRRVSDRSVVASLHASLQVLAFSGDDSLVFVAKGPLVAGWRPTDLSVIDVRSGKTTWHEQGALMTGMDQPAGRDFEISWDAGRGKTGPLGTFLIIHGDGSVTRIPGSYTPA